MYQPLREHFSPGKSREATACTSSIWLGWQSASAHCYARLVKTHTVCVLSLKNGSRGGSFGRRYVGAASRWAGKMGRYAFWKRIFGGLTMGDRACQSCVSGIDVREF